VITIQDNPLEQVLEIKMSLVLTLCLAVPGSGLQGYWSNWGIGGSTLFLRNDCWNFGILILIILSTQDELLEFSRISPKILHCTHTITYKYLELQAVRAALYLLKKARWIRAQKPEKRLELVQTYSNQWGV
jgi:hypothetical protein